MPPAQRKSRKRKTLKDTAQSRQTSLLDAFAISSLSKKSTLTGSAAPSENGSTAGEDVIDILSSDAEPLASDVPMESSSPITVEDGAHMEKEPTKMSVKSGPPGQAGASRDAPILVPDSSPVSSPISDAKSHHVPLPLPKALYSIFVPRKRVDDRASPHKLYGKRSTKPSAPFPDAASQHVRGPQRDLTVSLVQFSRHESHRRLSQTDRDPSIYSRLAREHTADSSIITSCSVPLVSALDPSDTAARERCITTIPLNHRSYPALSRFLHPNVPSYDLSGAPNSSNMLWADRWRPRRAEEVLGNERSALYLRDWLLALKLQISGTVEAQDPSHAASDREGSQRSAKPKKKARGPRGTKRPRIVRDVERKRRRLDSEEPDNVWTADDDSDGGDPLDLFHQTDDDLEYSGNGLSRLKRVPDEEAIGGLEPTSEESSSAQVLETSSLPSDDIPPFSYKPAKFGDTIYNTILLAGPSGCGKTAAVYACAEELGWDVFEVYPGIGDRSGASLQKLIGEVGKNHLVRQTQHQPKAENDKPRATAKANFFRKRVVSDDEAEHMDVQVADAVPAEEVECPKPDAGEVSQSIVLIEEVDILYRDDANFWPTLVKIIKECRRPVVMVCNDISLVPLQDLPLQAVLNFQPCPTALAMSYLKLASLSENLSVNTKAVESFCESARNAAAMPDCRYGEPLLPRATPEVPFDLRRVINALQFGVGVSAMPVPYPQNRDDQSLEQLKRVGRAIECASFVDAGLRPPSSEVLRDLLCNSASSSMDEVIGYKHLSPDPDDITSYLPVTFSTYQHDKNILSWLLSRAAQFYPVPTDLIDTPDLPFLHTPHCNTLLPILDRLHVPREMLIRNPQAIFLDYEPQIRRMVRADDARIAAYAASRCTLGTTRRTRNSQRSQWESERWVQLDEEERAILNRTALNVDADVGEDVDVHVDAGLPAETDPGLLST